jgi:hypothetical protein
MPLKLAKPLPAGTEYLVPLAEELAPKHGISPYLMLGITYAESNYGLALKPKTPEGSGDFIARPANANRDALMAKTPLPGVERKQVPSIKSRGINEPVMAWVPTHTGWGLGLYQLDWESHFEFVRTGAWKDPRKAMDYALKLLANNKKFLAGKNPTLAPHELVRAMVASYNAGAGRVNKFLADKKDIDTCTFHPGYIDKICNKADELAGASGAYLITTV